MPQVAQKCDNTRVSLLELKKLLQALPHKTFEETIYMTGLEGVQRVASANEIREADDLCESAKVRKCESV